MIMSVPEGGVGLETGHALRTGNKPLGGCSPAMMWSNTLWATSPFDPLVFNPAFVRKCCTEHIDR